MSNVSISTSLINTISDESALDLLADLGEVGIDQIIDNEILKDVPVFGSLTKIFKLGIGIREQLFIRKLTKFLLQLRDVSQEEKAKFLAKMQKDKEFQQKVGENLLLILERLDDMEKPDLVGKAFRAYMAELVTYDEFTKLASAIDRADISDLRVLAKMSIITGFSGKGDWEQRLANCGLMRIEANWKLGDTLGRQGGTEVYYTRNHLNQLLVAVCFQEKAQEAIVWLKYRKSK